MRTTLGTLTLALAWLTAVNPAQAQDEPKAGEPPLARPTRQHDRLKKDVGTWDAAIKMWSSPDAQPEEARGTETNRMLGGLWLISDFEADFGGMDFRGHGQTGYDPKQGKYVGTWVDSMTDKLMTLSGTYDEEARELVMFADSVHPATGKPIKERLVSKYVDDDTRVFTSYLPGEDGKEVKFMEIKYKRRKS